MKAEQRQALLADRDLEHLVEEFRAGQTVFVSALPLGAQAVLALALAHALDRPLLWLGDSPKTLDLFHRDLLSLASKDEAKRVAFFPSLEEAGRGGAAADISGDRLLALQACLQKPGPLLVATCAQALLQTTLSPDEIQAAHRVLHAGDALDPARLVADLEKLGYRFEVEVQEKGQAARRGGLLDFWPPTEQWPLRLEFTGAQLESIRAFDPALQRSVEPRTAATLVPASERPLSAQDSSLLDYLAPDTLWFWSEPESIRHHGALSLAAQENPKGGTLEPATRFDALRLQWERRFKKGCLVCGLDAAQEAPAYALDLKPCEGLPALDTGSRMQPDLIQSEREKFVANLQQKAAEGWRVEFFFNTEGTRERFEELAADAAKAESGKRKVESGPTASSLSSLHFALSASPSSLLLHIAPLTGGFVVESRRWLVVAESDLYGFRKTLPGRYELHGKKTGPVRAGSMLRVADWSDLDPGDLVVHADQGIGKYLGLYEVEFQGRQQEVLAIEYADKARLYVPVNQAHLLSRYVGVGRHRPELHALGGTRWEREKKAAQRAVADLAGQLLELQAARDALPGHAFAPDSAWQQEFENAFPFTETPDQLSAIKCAKSDMESTRPMDRLICGDVGYGKTEVAMRAAFKAVMDGKQVAMLVPTTILAQQHFESFAERFAAYPFTIEMLSRFRSREEQADVVRRLREGGVDIVIGTHRLVQKDVAFKDLGLVIIDEEQRFGVQHKERLKQYRQLVDVLTLTATPIPRTLYLSLTGARDLSTIQTPPLERLPVETIVAPMTEEIIRTAILRELDRGGQIFYLHNRVQTIQLALENLRALVPEAKIAVAHGQMAEGKLAEIMHRFTRGDFDVLLCTTIIESGLDIPTVNTILIERADRFGLAELYQLRGRVGRYKHQAFAYLLLPRHGRLFDTARKRIGAIKQYSSLGAGFKLALRDLEIRGAGNLLGAAQSGHIAAVGFDLYCQLLKRSVALLKGEKPPLIVDVETRLDFLDFATGGAAAENSAVLPPDYIEDESLRVRAYRKIAEASAEKELEELRADLRDRFGPIPPAASCLLKVAKLRIAAAERGVRSIEVAEDKVMMRRGADDCHMPGGHYPRLHATTPATKLDELIRLVRAWR
ncbi:MAG: transcription-repair coupling factor [Kiritimatiellaeota bacterium]|nr:transcription-repair coupling factor [Kiritimatiellota bacterium]